MEDTRGRVMLVVDSTTCLSLRASGRASGASAPADRVAVLFVCSACDWCCGNGELAVYPRGVLGVPGTESSAAREGKDEPFQAGIKIGMCRQIVIKLPNIKLILALWVVTTSQHGVITQKTNIEIFAAVRTTNFICRIQNLIKMRSAVLELLHAGGRTGRWTDRQWRN
jgi:hypothetical protein